MFPVIRLRFFFLLILLIMVVLTAATAFAQDGTVYLPVVANEQPTEEPTNTWTHMPTGVQDTLYAVYFVDRQTGWVAGANGIIMHTMDGGINWTPQSSGSEETLLDLFFIDHNTGWAVGGTAILTTNNGGATWEPRSRPATTFMEAVQFTDANHGWIAGCHYTLSGITFTAHGYVFRTLDGGETWTIASRSGISYRCVTDLYFLDSSHGWLATSYTGSFPYPTYTEVYVTSDAGDSWVKQTTPSGIDGTPNVITFTDANTGWIGGDYGLLYSNNGGSNWSLLGNGVTSVESIAFGNASVGWLAPPILRTNDAGATWTPEITDSACPQNDVLDLHFPDANNGWAVGYGGLVCRYR